MATQYMVHYFDAPDLLSQLSNLFDCGHGHHFQVEIDNKRLIVSELALECLGRGKVNADVFAV